MVTDDGKLPGAERAFLADALGTMVGAVSGTSTVTSYVESATGVEEGGRTGLTAVTVAVLFVLALFLTPLFVAVPAIELDVALIHMNRADASGNGQFLGPDFFFDDLFCMAAKRRFMSCEKVIPTEDFSKGGSIHTLRINRMMVDGVIEAPNGAHFTECPPDYGRDEAFQREYAATARDPEAWEAFKARYLDVASEQAYQQAVKSR